MDNTYLREVYFGCLRNKSAVEEEDTYLLSATFATAWTFGSNTWDFFSFVSWVDFRKPVQILLGNYFSVAVFLNLKLVVLNLECLALLYRVCIANPLTEQEFRAREMPQSHRLGVLLSCLENKIPLVYKISTGQL